MQVTEPRWVNSFGGMVEDKEMLTIVNKIKDGALRSICGMVENGEMCTK